MNDQVDTPNWARKAPKTIAVIGAGVTGLLIAQGLQKNGFQVMVYERDPSLEYRDARPVSFMIHWGFERLENLLPPALWSLIHTTYCNPELSPSHESAGIPFFNGHTGELLFQSPPAVMRRATRQKLRRLISQGLDIRWGMTIKTVEAQDGEMGGGASVIFEDGSEAVVDMVVGADGPRSKVREILLGGEKARCAQSDFVCGYTSAVIGKERAEMVMGAHPIWAMAYHSMGVCAIGVEDAKDPSDPSTWAFNITRIWRGESPRVEGPAAIQVIKENTKTYCEPFKSAVGGIPDDSPAFVRPLTYWRPVPWPNFNGRVTLAGDAAHPMLPFRGQGLNHAMDDAFKFVQSLVEVSKGNKGLGGAISEYDADVVERGAKAVDTAVGEGQLVQNMDRLMEMTVVKKGIAKG